MEQEYRQLTKGDMGMKLLSIDDVLTIAEDSVDATFSMLNGKEYYVVDTKNKIFGMKDMDGFFTYEHLFSYYRKDRVFFQL